MRLEWFAWEAHVPGWLGLYGCTNPWARSMILGLRLIPQPDLTAESEMMLAGLTVEAELRWPICGARLTRPIMVVIWSDADLIADRLLERARFGAPHG